MLDEDDKPWLIEINAICNMVHSKNSKVDTVREIILYLFNMWPHIFFLPKINFFDKIRLFSKNVYFWFIFNIYTICIC